MNEHLLHHVKQPVVILTRYKAPIRLTFKSKSNNNFEIVTSPTTISPLHSFRNLIAPKKEESFQATLEEDKDESSQAEMEEADEEAHISFSPNFAIANGLDSPMMQGENSNSSINFEMEPGEGPDEGVSQGDYGHIPGAEPTPPPEPSPEYPKIRIKTTGLLKESLTITEITDDNPNGDLTQPPGKLSLL